VPGDYAMHHLSAETLSQVMFGMGLLIGLVIVGVLVVQRFRGSAAEKGPTAKELITNFQEMRSRGDFSDADFLLIWGVLGG
jgi:hypothetical protein